MKELATITFEDVESGDEALAIVRATEGYVVLCLSLRQNGDVEVTFRANEFRELLAALREAGVIAFPQG